MRTAILIMLLASLMLNSGCDTDTGENANTSPVTEVTEVNEGAGKTAMHKEENEVTGEKKESEAESEASKSKEKGKDKVSADVTALNDIGSLLLNTAITDKENDAYVLSGYSVNEALLQLKPYATGEAKEALNKVTSDITVEDDSFLSQNLFLVDTALKLKTEDTSNFVVKDLADESIVPYVNDFVSKSTNDCIPEMIQQPFAGQVAVLNATYFKGKWEIPFSANSTGEDIFYCEDGKEVTKDFMRNRSNFLYNGSDMIELKYKDSNLVMDIIKDVDTVTMSQRYDEYLAGLDNMKLETTDIMLKMPKFEVRTDIDVATGLKGVEPYSGLFAPNCIDKLADDQCIDEIKQKAMIRVDEEGTEAAAVTMIATKTTSAPRFDYVEFTVDHPFLFVIRDTQTNAVIFTGFVRA